MIRKVIVILLLSSGLGILLYLKPWKEDQIQDPRIIDRLPSADFIGTMNPLELVKELSGLINYNKLQYRQFISYDFLLSQSRSLGINLQNPVYLFGYENGNWGCIIELNDDSKIENGLAQLKSLLKLQKKSTEGLSYFYFKEEKISIFHEKDYLLIYNGTNFPEVLNEIHRSKYGEVRSEWSSFLSEEKFKNESLVIYSNWKKFKQYGIEKAMFAHDNDSSNFKLKSYLKKISPFYLSVKNGPSIVKGKSITGNFVNVHLNVDEFKKHPDDILYTELKKLSRKFGFPFEDFIKSWQGDVSFFEGGNTVATELYKETELDDEFNPVLVEKQRNVVVPAYSSLLTINRNFNRLYSKLKLKGFITEETDKIRFLISPPLTKRIKKNQLLLYSGGNPVIKNDNANEIQWWYKGTKFKFQLQNIQGSEITGLLNFSVKKIAKENFKVKR